MINYHLAKQRIGIIYAIGFGHYNRIKDLNLSWNGFWQSWQALFWGIIITIFRTAVIVYSQQFETNEANAKLIFLGIVTEIIRWLLPLFVFYLCANFLQIRYVLPSLVIAYNWLQLSIILASLPFILVVLAFPSLNTVFVPLLSFVSIYFIYLSYRVFDIILNEKFLFTLGIFILYTLLSLFTEPLINLLI